MAPLTANTTSMDQMAHFGEALRCERQRRSVSLEDIAQTTKVTVRSLKALESEAFDQLPGGILSKGIVRSYVRCLGLDESEWVARFLDASGQKTPPDPTQPEKDWVAFALNISKTRAREITDAKLRWAGVVVLMLLLAGFGWIVWGYVHQRVASLSSMSPIHYSASITPAASKLAAAPKKPHHRAR
jgi:cytoskeletal protein RodZ